MKKWVTCIVVLCALLGSLQAAEKDESVKYEGELKRVENISRWFIQEGVRDYYVGRPSDIALSNYLGSAHELRNEKRTRERVKERGAYLFASYVDAVDALGDLTLVDIRIQTKWYVNRTTCYERIVDGEDVYEYWIIQAWNQAAFLRYRNCIFMVTKAKGLSGKRMVLKEEINFFPEYEIREGLSIRFPVDDMRTLRNLMAWEYPDSYKGYPELTDFRVIYGPDDPDGTTTYDRVPVGGDMLKKREKRKSPFYQIYHWFVRETD